MYNRVGGEVPVPIANVAVFSNVRPRDLEVADRARAALERAGLRPDAEPYELVLSVGGDGTFLESVRRYRELEVPFAGINTGSLGFLQELVPEDVDMMARSLATDSYRVETYPLLEAVAQTPDGAVSAWAFNDVVVEREASRALHLEVTLGEGTQMQVVGDGLIVATPAGSTAYAAAAGGPYIHPSVSAFQLVPVSPHPSEVYRSLAKPLVLPADERVTVTLSPTKGRSLRVVTDGALWLTRLDSLTLGLCDQGLQLLRFGQQSFCQRVAQKLMR